MESAFDRIMSAPEVLVMILDVAERKHLRTTASVCRGWYSVAVEVIWRECKLWDLLQVFAPLKHENKPDTWCFDPNVLVGNWERFTAHARLAVALEYDFDYSNRNLSSCVMSQMQVFRDINGGTPFFPLLRRLTWTSGEDISVIQMMYIIGNAPELAHLWIDGRLPHQSQVRLLRLLGTISPAKLHSFHLQCKEPRTAKERKDLHAEFSDFIKAVQHDSQLRQLAILPLSLTHELTVPIIQNLSHLLELRAEVAVTTTGEFYHYVQHLAQAAPQLRRLLIQAPKVVGIRDGMAFLRPLKQCAQLINLHLGGQADFALSFDPVEVRSLGSLWLKLETLHIPAQCADGKMMPLEWLCHFAVAFPQLKSLGARFNVGIDPPDPTNVETRFNQLRRLSVGNSVMDRNSGRGCRIGEFLGELCPPGLQVYDQCPCMDAMPEEDAAWKSYWRVWDGATDVMKAVHRAHASALRRLGVAVSAQR